MLPSCGERTSMNERNGTLCVLGASGFVGKHLIASEHRLSGHNFHLLFKNKNGSKHNSIPIRAFAGDLCHPFIEEGFIVRNATVINLAYLAGDDVKQNTSAIDYLIEKCIDAKIQRLIHCSTAVVAGDVEENKIDENTPCRPVTKYERCKMEVETRLVEKCRDRIDLIILRPTAVFGLGGKNLNSTIDFVLNSKVWRKKLRMSIFKTRQMNLVSVENVSAAIHFLAGIEHKIGVRRYIVSEDDDPLNTFGEVCRIIHEISETTAPKVFPIPFKRSVQRILLRTLHGPSIVPDRRYLGRRLAAEGFRLPFDFSDCVRRYVSNYLKSGDNTI